MKTEEAVGNILNGYVEAAKQKLLKDFEGKVEQCKIDTLILFIKQNLSDINKKIMSDDAVSIYNKLFTEHEIKKLIAFYESPVGKKAVELAPEIMLETMKVMAQKYMPDYLEQIQKKAKQLFNEQVPPKEDKI